METTNQHQENLPNQEQPWQTQAVNNDLHDRDDDKEKEEETDEETPDRDWGTVDPQEHPGRSTGMDPSGPGSAV